MLLLAWILTLLLCKLISASTQKDFGFFFMSHFNPFFKICSGIRLCPLIYKKWSNENQSELIETAGSVFRGALSAIMPSAGSPRQLPPSVAGIGPKSRVMFPLGMGHASEYIRHRVALIG